MRDIADELVVAQMAKFAQDRHGVDLDDLPPDVLEGLEDEAIAIVEDLLEVEYERDLESRLSRIGKGEEQE